MVDVIEAVEAAEARAHRGTLRSPLRVLLAGALSAAAVGVLGVCITGGAEPRADRSPTPVGTIAPGTAAH